MNFDEVIVRLQALADPKVITRKQEKFAITAGRTLGIYQADLNKLAKEIGQDSGLAVALFDSGFYEARLLCAKIYDPKDLTQDRMQAWVETFENWEICDTFAMKLFAQSPLAVPMARLWSERQPEFEKRAAFAIIAAYCMADKIAGNGVFEEFLTLIFREAGDERLYVRKAVNWALRNIGKRNPDLNKLAIAAAQEISTLNNKAARWIARDALKELQSNTVRMSDYPRAIYRI